MKKIKIGKLVNTRGLKGEVKVIPYTDFIDERFKVGNEIILTTSNEDIKLKIERFQDYKNQMILLKFAGYDDINQIEKYKGCELYCDAASRDKLDDDTYYADEIIGCQVYCEGDLIGEVEEVMATGANFVLRVNQKILIPYVKTFIVATDIENKRIDINKIKGLL